MCPTMITEALPEDMMEEILTRLEPAHLCQLKTVSKTLNHLISSSDFIKKQLLTMKRQNRTSLLLQSEFSFVPLFYDGMNTDSASNIRLVSVNDNPIQIVASSNGLLLFCNLDDEFFLMNPVVNKKHQLPAKRIAFPDGCNWAQVIFGMGYLDDSDDYKVIRISLFDSPDLKTEVMMYSRNAGSWSKCSDFPHDYPLLQSGVCVHGRIHWRSALYTSEHYATYINVVSGEYGELPIPEVPLMYGDQQLVGLDDETLALSCTVLFQGIPYILWVLKDYFDPQSWFKISINTWEIVHSKVILNLQPLSILRPNSTNLLFRLDPIGDFGLYNIITKTFTLIPSTDKHEGFSTVYGFVPCLHSPNPKETNLPTNDIEHPVVR